jgi:Protein of unknown function (DUF2934)
MATKSPSVSRVAPRTVRNPVASRSIENSSPHQPDEQARDVHTRISERAYALFVKHGRKDGHALEDWLEAEQQVFTKG